MAARSAQRDACDGLAYVRVPCTVRPVREDRDGYKLYDAASDVLYTTLPGLIPEGHEVDRADGYGGGG